MNFKPTPSQREAIITVDRHVAVTAGAGSGKTRVLVERCLNLIEQGVPIEKMAAITFTKKAAQEMKDRLCEARPDLITELEQAQISTIHSLCQRIIQEHPLEAGVDPRFRVGEEWEIRALLFEVIENVVSSYDHPEELGTLREVADLVWELYKSMIRQGDTDFIRPVADAAPEFSVEVFCRTVDSLLAQVPETPFQKRIMSELQKEWPGLRNLLEFPHDDLKLEALEELDRQIKKIRGGFADRAAGVKEGIQQGQRSIEHAKGAKIVSWLGKTLEEVHRRFNESKRLQGILDFNDLEQLAYGLLQLASVRQNYDFAHLMVDEFQDTNPLQKKIVDCLVEGGARLFVVGDPKQSIYRFRGADVNVFVQTQKEVAKTGKTIFLAENFRSRPELIEFANRLFPRIMEGEEIPFESSAYTKKAAGEPRVTLLHTPAPDATLEEARVFEAEQIALKIKELVAGGRYLYQDISVLFRTMTNIQIYEKALQTAGVPYVNLSGRGFYSRQEIQDVLNYFRWLADPGDQVARLAVLRSPFYLISDQGLYWVRHGYSERLTAQERVALQKSEEDYAYLSALIRRQSAPEVITSMLERTNYVQSTWRLPFGPQKAANIEKLSELSWDLFARGIVSVPEQIRYIDLMSQDAKGEGEALLDAEHANVVILRTVHGAKGLEFPVGFLADTNGCLTRSRGSRVLYHPDFGLRCKGMEGYEQLRQQELQEEISEAKRLLYVAFTRAEEEVFWCVLDGPFQSVSWWAWLKKELGSLPAGLYTQAAGDLSAEKFESRKEKPLRLEISRYGTLPPVYEGASFSVTALMNYVRCPRCFYLRYILGVTEGIGGFTGARSRGDSEISAVQRGNIVHRVCEQITDASQLSDLVYYAAAVEGVPLDPVQKRQLERIIAVYLDSGFFSRIRNPGGKQKIYREKEFLLPAGEFLINGLVDQVFLSPSHLEVVDFKSNWIRADQVQEVGGRYLVQLRIYAWAMSKEFGLPAAQSLAYFLIPNKIYALDSGFLNFAKTEEWIVRTCWAIIKGAEQGLKAFPASETCLNCGERSWFGNSGLFGENREDYLDWIEGESM